MIEVMPALARSRSARIGFFTHSALDTCAGLRFLRQVEAVALDVGVGGIEQRQVVFIATRLRLSDQVVLEGDQIAVIERLGDADQGHAVMGQPSEIDGAARHGHR